jgi:hypothetical protein
MVLGETVYRFDARRPDMESDGHVLWHQDCSWESIRRDGTQVFAGDDFLARTKEFLVDANANQKLCIAVDISEQIASPLAKNGEG